MVTTKNHVPKLKLNSIWLSLPFDTKMILTVPGGLPRRIVVQEPISTSMDAVLTERLILMSR